MVTFMTVVNTNHIHCLCPAHHLFVRNSTKFLDLEDGTSIIGTAFQCKPVSECNNNYIIFRPGMAKGGVFQKPPPPNRIENS